MSGYPDPSQPPPSQQPSWTGASPGASGPVPGASQPASGPRKDQLAGFGARLLALILDGIITGIIGAILGGVAGATGSTALAALAQLVSLVIGVAYAVYFISTPRGQTPGMMALSIRAVDEATGARVSVGKAFARWAMSLVSGLAIALGYLWMLFDDRNRTWHDMVAGTLVVKASEFPPPS